MFLQAFVDEFLQRMAAFALAAAPSFFGTWFAFRLRLFEDRAKQSRDQVQALQVALFTLSSQRTLLLAVKMTSLDPLRERPHRHLFLRTFVHLGQERFLDINRLSFLVGTRAGVALLAQLEMTEQAYRSARGLLDQRAAARESVEPAIVSAGKVPSLRFVPEVERQAGERAIIQLRAVTDALYEQVESAVDMNGKALDNVAAFLRRSYPNAEVPEAGTLHEVGAAAETQRVEPPRKEVPPTA